MTSKTSRYGRAILAAALLMFAASGAQAQEKVQLGVVGSTGNSGIFVAADFGYWKEEGLDVTIVRFDSAARMIPLLGTGQLDAAAGSSSASLYNAAMRKIELKIAAGFMRTFPKNDYESLLVRKDWIDSGKFKSYADLKGARVALNAPGVSLASAFNEAAKRGGLTFDDLNVSHIGFNNQIAAMQNGAIDATITVEPFISAMVNAGSAVIFAPVDDFYPSFQVGLIFFGEQFTARRAIAEKFLRGFIRGTRTAAAAVKDSKYLDTPEANRVVAAVSNNMGLPPEKIRALIPPPLDVHVNLNSLRTELAFFRSRGDVPNGALKVEDMTDLSFLENAEKSLDAKK